MTSHVAERRSRWCVVYVRIFLTRTQYTTTMCKTFQKITLFLCMKPPLPPPPPNPSPLLLKSYSPPQRPDPENFNELRRGYWRTNSQKGYSKFWCFQSHCGWHEWSEMKTFPPLGLHKNFCFPCTVVKRAKVKNGLNFIHLHIWHTQRNVTKRLFAMNWFTSYLFRE